MHQTTLSTSIATSSTVTESSSSSSSSSSRKRTSASISTSTSTSLNKRSKTAGKTAEEPIDLLQEEEEEDEVIVIVEDDDEEEHEPAMTTKKEEEEKPTTTTLLAGPSQNTQLHDGPSTRFPLRLNPPSSQLKDCLTGVEPQVIKKDPELDLLYFKGMGGSVSLLLRRLKKSV